MDCQDNFVKSRILLVDDDEVCLQVVSEMFRTLSFEVATITHPMEALPMLRASQFDLILSDYHMPDMSGMELQRRVDEEFKLPVIIMSSDDRETRIRTSLRAGALHYIVKPVKPDDVRSVEQYVVAEKREKSIVVEENECAGDTSSLPSKRNENSEKRVRRKILEIYEQHPPAPRNKPKVVWTNSLHERFIQAINVLGDKAVPRRIVEVMNVPGLSRENIASHLQKYRIFLKQLGKNDSLKLKSPDRALKSNFAPNLLSSSSSTNKYLELFELGFGKVPSFLHNGNPCCLQFPTPQNSCSSSTLLGLGIERSNPLLGKTSAKSPLYEGTDFHCGQGSGLSSSIQIPPSTLGMNFPWQGQRNTMYSHPTIDHSPLDMSKHMSGSQQSETMPFLGFNSGISRFSNGLALNDKEGIGTMGDNVIDEGVLSSNPFASNYVGDRLTNNEELVGGGGLSQFINFENNISGVQNNNHGGFDMANLQSVLPSGAEMGLPSMAALEQQFVTNQGENNNFKFDTMNGPSLPNVNNTCYQRSPGDGDCSSVFPRQVNQPYMNDEYFLQHPSITNGSYVADYENYAQPNELLVSEFANLCHVQDNMPPGDPFSLQQHNGNLQEMETNTGMTGLVPNDKFPSSVHSPEQQQQGEGKQLLDSILPPLDQNSEEQMDPEENIMDWEQEEYMESLLRAVREFLED